MQMSLYYFTINAHVYIYRPASSLQPLISVKVSVNSETVEKLKQSKSGQNGKYISVTFTITIFII